jgi:hypothetical protein
LPEITPFSSTDARPEKRKENPSSAWAQTGRTLNELIELHKGLTFPITAKPILSAEEQSTAWFDAFGAY